MDNPIELAHSEGQRRLATQNQLDTALALRVAFMNTDRPVGLPLLTHFFVWF
jgi:hypothetical protein